MPNIGKVISSHNQKVLNPPDDTPPCVCRAECQVEKECEKKSVIYKCRVKELQSGQEETYVGLTANSFKSRLTKHNKSFRDRNYNPTSLSKHIWKLRDANKQFQISWQIIDQAKPFNPASKMCNLCLREKYFIIYKKKKATLNKKNEFFGYCLHKNKYSIANH